MQPFRSRIAVLTIAALALTGCASSVAGTPVGAGGAGTESGQTGTTAPTNTAGSTNTAGPTGSAGQTGTAGPTGSIAPIGQSGIQDSEVGLKPGVPPADLDVTGDKQTQADTLAKDTLADVITFYTQIFPDTFGQKFVPPAHFLSYDSNDKSAKVCGHSLYQAVNASYASPPCDTVVWDRGVLLPNMLKSIGVLAAPTVFAHEMGHRVQAILKFDHSKNSVLVGEQQADCYAGAYWRWVEDGNSKYFNFNASEGMRQVLTAMVSFRDAPGGDPAQDDGTGQGAHGDAFDRTFAFGQGYASGAARCNKMDQAEVDARVSESPFSQIPNPQNAGSLPITDQLLGDVAQTVNDYFSQTTKGYRPPAMKSYTGSSPPPCDGYRAGAPASYCPADNTVTYDLAELQRIGTPTAGFESFNGDFSAIILLVSRYALAAQAAGNSAVTGNDAGLRALCYAGTWASWMRNPQGPKRLALSPSDLDKAVYEVINSPVPASDANGATTVAIFDRVQAFGIGVTQPIDKCFDYYSG